MNDQCLHIPFLRHLLKARTPTTVKKKKKKNPNIENLIKSENG
jgi:hypothetical protein